MKEIVNIPYKSKWIGKLYLLLTFFVAFIYILVYFEGIQDAPVFAQAIFAGVMIGVLLMMFFILFSFYNTKYRIKDNVLTSWSPFMFIKINLKDIKSVEKVMFPFGFRVGASFYCGVYYIPSLGWARVIITNMKDVVLIRTKSGRKYIISPKNPKLFMKQLKK
jgi:uncharacterized membrane protein (DUF485 family)